MELDRETYLKVEKLKANLESRKALLIIWQTKALLKALLEKDPDYIKIMNNHYKIIEEIEEEILRI